MNRQLFTLFAGMLMVGLSAGCAPIKTTDYSAFKQARPHSILVLPPINESPDVKATYSVLSQVTFPLAEAGYYVLPVALVDETLRQNGMTTPGDVHQIATVRLQEIFGADAALYITVKAYGSRYTLLNSATVVTAQARLVNLKTGAELWSASASSEEGRRTYDDGVIGLLISAAVKQVINNVGNDTAHPVAGAMTQRLLSAGTPTGLPYGPRSPKYGSD